MRKHNYYSIAFSTVISWQWIFFLSCTTYTPTTERSYSSNKIIGLLISKKSFSFRFGRRRYCRRSSDASERKETKSDNVICPIRPPSSNFLICEYIILFLCNLYQQIWEKNAKKKRKVTNVTFRFWDMVSVIACNHMTRTMKYWKFCSVVVDSFFLSLSVYICVNTIHVLWSAVYA